MAFKIFYSLQLKTKALWQDNLDKLEKKILELENLILKQLESQK